MKDKEAVVKEHAYEINQLLENCQAITGERREVGEGAVYGVKETTMTKTQFKKRVEEFLKRGVK